MKNNRLNYKLLQFVSALQYYDCHNMIHSERPQEEILEELSRENEIHEFTLSQLKSIHGQEIAEKEERIRQVVNSRREQVRRLRETLSGLRSENKKLHEENRQQSGQNSVLRRRIDGLYEEIKRLKKVINREYGYTRVWGDEFQR